MLHHLLFALWFLLPAAVANATPIISAVLPGLKAWDAPLDSGHSWRGQRIFGDHKTWRGLLSGMLVATLIFWLQQLAYRQFGWARSVSGDVDYGQLPLLLGTALGFGALLGDALESMAKRQRGIRSGKSWLFFDQLDYIIGAILLSLPFVVVSLIDYVLMLVLWFGMHLLFSVIGWKLRLKDAPI
jgi:CDP-2,3-bis-(O-geranylgeranyl)-sn-glycerol synthase